MLIKSPFTTVRFKRTNCKLLNFLKLILLTKDGFFSPHQVSFLKNKLADLLAEIRPNAVALVDAFDYPDKTLDSCLGRYDGQVYPALYEYAKNSPFNEQEVRQVYSLWVMFRDMQMYLILAVWHQHH